VERNFNASGLSACLVNILIDTTTANVLCAKWMIANKNDFNLFQGELRKAGFFTQWGDIFGTDA
jgi:hypothetical protein